MPHLLLPEGFLHGILSRKVSALSTMQNGRPSGGRFACPPSRMFHVKHSFVQFVLHDKFSYHNTKYTYQMRKT